MPESSAGDAYAITRPVLGLLPSEAPSYVAGVCLRIVWNEGPDGYEAPETEESPPP
jgi:hypothetical protein